MGHTLISRANRMASVPVLMLMGLCLSAAQQVPPASDHKVDMADLIKDVQMSASGQDGILTIVWMPGEFWEAALGKSSKLSPEFVNEFITALNFYNIIAVTDGKLGALGGIDYRSEAEIRSSISVVGAGGQSYLPIAVSDMDAGAKNILDIMKPIMANMLGRMGENMNFFLFPGKDKQGERLFYPKKEGRFTVKMGEKEFHWRLPLGSLLSSKICPKCGETFSGAYKFCPWDGSALVEKRDQRPPRLPAGN